jgi:hypothetical protein
MYGAFDDGAIPTFPSIVPRPLPNLILFSEFPSFRFLVRFRDESQTSLPTLILAVPELCKTWNMLENAQVDRRVPCLSVPCCEG